MSRLKDKVALVTGAGSGIGKAIAKRFLQEGAQVVCTDKDAEGGRRSAAEFGADFLHQDVCDEERWREVSDEVQKRYGCLNVLVNNAGILGPAGTCDPESTSLRDWRAIFAVNVEGVFLGCRTAIAAMRRAGSGSIINVSSVAGLLATPYATAYGASKATVRQLTKSVAQHCAEQGLKIRCNSVHPGDVRTPLWDTRIAEVARGKGVSMEDVVAKEKSLCPMGDFAAPEDIAAAVTFLASNESTYVTGTMMIVDGGLVNCDTFRR